MKQAQSSSKTFVIGLLILIALRLLFAWDPIGKSVSTITQPIAEFVHTIARTNMDTAENEEVNGALNTALQQENDDLRSQLNLTNSGSRITAEITRIDMSTYRKWVWINKGSAEGMVIDDTVVADGFLFGRIVAVEKHRAQVQVVTDPEFSVTAQYGEQHGVVKNQYGSLIFALVPRGDIAQNQLITTDGIDGIFKPNIPVALIDANITEPGAVFFSYSIFLRNNPSNVRFVQVVR